MNTSTTHAYDTFGLLYASWTFSVITDLRTLLLLLYTLTRYRLSLMLSELYYTHFIRVSQPPFVLQVINSTSILKREPGHGKVSV